LRSGEDDRARVFLVMSNGIPENRKEGETQCLIDVAGGPNVNGKRQGNLHHETVVWSQDVSKVAADLTSRVTATAEGDRNRSIPKTAPDLETVRVGYKKVTIVLSNHQVVFLDTLALAIRQRSGCIIKRAAMFRAIVGALEESRIDLSSVLSEDQLKDRLRDGLRLHGPCVQSP